MALKISLLALLREARFGSLVLRKNCSPEDIFAGLGRADEVYTPQDLDLAYEKGREACFPLVVQYGDIEFLFAGSNELSCLHVDSFCGVGQQAYCGSFHLLEGQLLREGLLMPDFLSMLEQAGLEFAHIRPHAPPYARLVSFHSGMEVGFEHDDPTMPGSQESLRWFSWVPPQIV